MWWVHSLVSHARLFILPKGSEKSSGNETTHSGPTFSCCFTVYPVVVSVQSMKFTRHSMVSQKWAVTITFGCEKQCFFGWIFSCGL